jgi:hypothetical protein
LGSFLWSAKKHNLFAFLVAAYDLFRRNGIEIYVVGLMRDDLRREIAQRWPAVTVTGKVDQVTPYLEDARIGVIPEEAGGGFKLKALDYVFHRVPLFSLQGCVNDLQLVHGQSAMLYADMNSLCTGVVTSIVDTGLLEKLQNAAVVRAAPFLGIEKSLEDLNAGLRSAGILEPHAMYSL